MKKIITLLMLCYCFSMNAQQTAIADNAALKLLINDWIADPNVAKFTDNTNDQYYGLINDWDVSLVTDMLVMRPTSTAKKGERKRMVWCFDKSNF